MGGHHHSSPAPSTTKTITSNDINVGFTSGDNAKIIAGPIVSGNHNTQGLMNLDMSGYSQMHLGDITTGSGNYFPSLQNLGAQGGAAQLYLSGNIFDHLQNLGFSGVTNCHGTGVN